LVLSLATSIFTSGGNCACSRQLRAHAVHRFDHVGAGLRTQDHDDGRLAVEQAEVILVFHAVHHFRHVLQADRRAVAPADDQIAVVGGAAAADGVGRFRIDLQAAAVALDRAARAVGVGGLHGGAHVFHRQALRFSAYGFSSTRTAGSELPPSSTSPTPVTCDRRCSTMLETES
jgi:hypothetical protein